MAKIFDSTSRTFTEFLILPGRTTRKTGINQKKRRRVKANMFLIPGSQVASSGDDYLASQFALA